MATVRLLPFAPLALTLVALAVASPAHAESLDTPGGRVVTPATIDVPVPPDLPVPDPSIDVVLTDGAGTEMRDTPSGGPAPSRFVHLESDTVCGLACRVTAANDEVLAIVPGAGDADFPWHWASSLATVGNAGGNYAEATVWVDTNGHVAFQDPVVPHPVRSTSVPNVAAPSAIVAANWQDLDPSLASGLDGLYVAITGSAPNRVLYIEWWNVANTLDPTCKQQFEVALFETGYAAEVYYLTSCTTFAATGGEESSGGAVGLLYFNGAVPQNTGVRYRDVRVPVGMTQTVVCAVPGANGWCKTNDMSVTFSDTQDLHTTHVGTGVVARVYRLDGGANVPYSRGVAIPLTLAEGSHTMTIIVADYAGNGGVANFARPDVDMTVPVATAVATCPAASIGFDGWCRAAMTTSGTSSDSISGIQFRTCRMDGVARTCNAAAYSTQGTHAWQVDTTDFAGWAASASRTIKLDSAAPAISLAQTCIVPGSAGWCRGALTVSGSATDATSGIVSVTCTLDGVASPCSTSIPEGSHAFVVSAADVAGNVASSSFTLKVDAIAPTASATFACAESVAGICVVSPLGYEGAGADGGSGVASTACSLDAAAALCAGDTSIDGAHALDVTVTDVAGNVASASASITLDTGAPDVSLGLTCATLSSSGWCLDASFGYLATATDGVSGVASLDCSVDGGPSDCDGTVTGEGAHTVTADAADAAGHTSSASASLSIDSVAPEIATTLDGLAGDNGWHRSAVTVSLACADATSGVQTLDVSVDGSAFSAYEGPFSVSNEGATEVVARCTDVAGHETTEATTIMIDTIAPAAALTTPAYAAAAYDVLWDASDATSGVALVVVEEALLIDALGEGYSEACASALDDAPLAANGACTRDPNPAVWCYRVTVRDAAGNEHVTARADPNNLEGLEGELAKCTLKATPGELPGAAAASVGLDP